MALVDEHKEVFREEVEQTVRTLTGFAPIEIARVVLDAGAMSKLLYHLHVVLNALLDALRTNMVAHRLEEVDLLNQIVLNKAYSRLGLLLRRYEQIGGINLIVGKLGNALERNAVNLLNAVYLVVPPCYAQHVVAVSHEHVYRVALHAESATREVDVVAQIERVDELAQKGVALHRFALLHRDDAVGHSRRSAHTVDARNRRDDNNVFSARE